MTKTEFPLFFSKNIINLKQDEFILTTNGDIVDWCLDYDKNTKWQSFYMDDLIDETIEIYFKNPDGYNEPRTFDKLMLFEMNLKEYKIQYQNWLGSVWGNWTDIPETIETINSEDNKIVSFNSITAWRVKIVMTSTFPANNHKTIRDFILCEELYESVSPMDTYNIKNKSKFINQRFYNGASQKIKSWDKYAVKVGFQQISQIERDKLKDIYKEYDAFIFIPEPYDNYENDYKLSDYYLVKWVSGWNEKYYCSIKSAGYNINIDLEEI